jgi:hypothetical protein
MTVSRQTVFRMVPFPFMHKGAVEKLGAV